MKKAKRQTTSGTRTFPADVTGMHPDEVFERSGFSMQRFGRFIEIQTRRTPSEQADLLRRVWNSRDEIYAEIQRAGEELLTLIRKYSSFDLTAHVWLRHGLTNADNYKETEAPQRYHFVEHLVMLELTSDSRRLTKEIVVAPQDVLRAEQLLGEIFDQRVLYYLTEGADPHRSGPPDTLDQARFKTLLREAMVGPPAYTHHWKQVLDGLFGALHVGAYLKEALGFDLREALTCVDGITVHISSVMSQRITKAKESESEMREELRRYMETGVFQGLSEHKAMFDAIRNLRSKDRKRFFSSSVGHWITTALPDTLSLAPSVLSSRVGIPPETAAKFLDAFSLQFGSTPRDYLIPSPSPAVRIRPIVRVESDYLCPLPFNLLWAIKPRFEEALKKTNRWYSYQAHRARFLVDEGLKALNRLLPTSQSFESLKYPIGQREEAELDGLVLFDRYAFLIEAKAGEFGGARRGGPDRIRRGLDNLVADPAAQAMRARDYIRKTENPVFSMKDGKEIIVDKAVYAELLPITLTLDSLDVFTPNLHQLRVAGVLESHDLPWAVCLTDLVAISEILQLPVEFTHYLRWRLGVNTAGDVSAGIDELNWLAVYLKEGPRPIRIPQDYDQMAFTSYTDTVDAYFLYIGGFRRKPVPRPAQPLPTPLRELLIGLANSGKYGFTEPAELLLDLDFDERGKFASEFRGMMAKGSKGSQPVTFEAEQVIIHVFPQCLTQEALRERITNSARPKDKKTVALAFELSEDFRIISWQVAKTS